jgi:hypothetical protein
MTVAESKARIELPWDATDRVLVAVASLLLLAFAVPWIAGWPVPDEAPRHFGFDGRPDRWGSPAVLMLLPLMALLMGGGLLVLARFPHVYNYPVALTGENASRQYRLGRRLVLAMASVISAVYLYIHIGSWRVAAGVQPGLSPLFLVAALLTVATIITAYFVAATRKR